MKVTIGLPVFNAARYVVDAINSIKAQTFKDWECIIIDDGSNDGSAELLREIIDDRFTLLSDGENLGLIHRLNQITGLATGDYLARMDSDDIMHPRRLEKQVEFLEAERGTDLLGTGAYLIDVDNNVYGVRTVADDFRFARLILGSPFVHPSVMGRREWFENNPYDLAAHRAEDYELWLRSSRRSRFANLPMPLIYYREAGLPYLEKYRLTSRSMRRVARRYLFQRGSFAGAAKSIALSTAKQSVFTMLHRLGKEEHWMRSRVGSLSALDHLNASVELNRAIRCEE